MTEIPYSQTIVICRDPDTGQKAYLFGWAWDVLVEYDRDGDPQHTTTVRWVWPPRRAYSEPTQEDFDTEPSALPGGPLLLDRDRAEEQT